MDANEGGHPIPALSDIFEENAMRYRQMPSLVHLASVKAASRFWVGKHAKERALEVVGHFEHGVLCSSYEKLSRELEKEVPKLSLPCVLVEHLTYYVERLGTEVLEWVILQSRIGSFRDPWKYFRYLHWTGRGRINARETARAIVAKGRINRTYKKRASKYYCLESSKKSLLKQVVANWSFCKAIPLMGELQYGIKHLMYHSNCDELLADCDYTLVKNEKVKCVRAPSFYRLAKCCDNEVLIGIWASFSQETKSRILTDGRFECRSVDFLCFLLSQMDYGQQTNFFQVHSKHVLLMIYKDWFFKDYFVPTFLHFLHTLDALGFLQVLVRIAQVLESNLPDIWFKEFFLELLQKLPEDFKARMASEGGFNGLKAHVIRCLKTKNPDVVEKLRWFLGKGA